MRILGIDPGKKGGLCFLDVLYSTIETKPMPLYDDGKIDVGKIQEWIIEYKIRRAYIELQQTRGRQGGNMTIGSNYGRLTAVLDLCNVQYEEIRPQEWQAILGLSGDKANTVEWCADNFYYVPMTSNRKNAKPHDGIADAIAIAVAGNQIPPF